jgi:aldehyde dehydrogenase (NAD+)
VQLLVHPVAAALAAGNTVVAKPSEVSPTVSAALAEFLPQYVDPDALAVVEGGVAETQALLAERFDHIFYTGNGTVARHVAEAAARNLTPVTLELGGKSPVIVDRDADLDGAARRIAWGKFMNAGQTCIAPDYVLVHEEVHDQLVDKLATVIRDRYGDDPKASESFGRIVNERHAQRLKGLLDAGGYKAVACGGTADPAARYVAPTVLAGVDPDAAVMGEEIFGPILPVLPVADVDEAVAYVNGHDKPLALYVFTNSGDTADRVLRRTSSGGACVNEVVSHIAIPAMPFGGVGPSGTGAYGGRWGFEQFSHRKAVQRRPRWLELKAVYPPYTKAKEKLLRRLL